MGIWHVLIAMSVHMNPKAHVFVILTVLIEIEGHLKVTGSHIHCKCVEYHGQGANRDVVTTDRY